MYNSSFHDRLTTVKIQHTVLDIFAFFGFFFPPEWNSLSYNRELDFQLHLESRMWWFYCVLHWSSLTIISSVPVLCLSMIVCFNKWELSSVLNWAYWMRSPRRQGVSKLCFSALIYTSLIFIITVWAYGNKGNGNGNGKGYVYHEGWLIKNLWCNQ